MFTVYVLYSKTFDKIYIGYTSDFQARLKSHNELGKKDWAIRYRPWEVVFLEEFETKSEALQREKYLKTGVGREYIRKFISEKGMLNR